jgi:hypothetical protein
MHTAALTHFYTWLSVSCDTVFLYIQHIKFYLLSYSQVTLWHLTVTWNEEHHMHLVKQVLHNIHINQIFNIIFSFTSDVCNLTVLQGFNKSYVHSIKSITHLSLTPTCTHTHKQTTTTTKQQQQSWYIISMQNLTKYGHNIPSSFFRERERERERGHRGNI